jgi:hypothetical protein
MEPSRAPPPFLWGIRKKKRGNERGRGRRRGKSLPKS